jgi:chromosomal replication initiator protein
MNTAPRTRELLTDEAPLSAPPRWHGFLILPENRLGLRAVRAVCRSTIAGKSPPANPVMLHGQPGAGKSRLIAVLIERLATAPEGVTVRVVSAGDFARQTDESFTDRDLSDCDLLALEDVQHLTDRTADAVCDLIDRRASRRRATIVTASAGPAGLTHLPRRLTSRLAAGLVVRLEPLSVSGRRAILADAATTKVRLTADALDWLAERSTGGGVRSALGALQNLAQVAKAFPGPLGRLEVEQVLAETGQPTSAALDVSTIVKRVAAVFGVGEAEILGTRRLRSVLHSRQVAMYLTRELTGLSLPRIGAAFGGRDHTTVLHACRKVEEEMAADAVLASRVSELRAALG